MELQRPMRVVTPTLDGDVLTALARVDAELTVSQLTTVIAGRTDEGIRRVLTRLVEQGIVLQRRVGRASAYALNRDHIAAAAVIDLATASTRLRARISTELAGWIEPPLYAALFGSAARGAMRTGSDIDILLVHAGDASDVWDRQVDTIAASITLWSGNDARPLVLSEDEVLGRAEREPVIRDIIAHGVSVHGDRRQFAAMATHR